MPLLYFFGFVLVPPVVIRNDDWTWEDLCHYLYEEKAFDNIVISPGPGSPTCANDIGKITDYDINCGTFTLLLSISIEDHSEMLLEDNHSFTDIVIYHGIYIIPVFFLCSELELIS